MSIFNVNFPKLRERLTPSFLRSTDWFSWIGSFSKPFQTTYNIFLAYRQNSLLLLSYNSRTKIFAEYLNDEFDPTLRRIYIVNTSVSFIRKFLYFQSEGNPNPFLYFQSEGQPAFYLKRSIEGKSDFDFEVFVPNGLTFDNDKMVSIIKSVKLAGKRFIIKSF